MAAEERKCNGKDRERVVMFLLTDSRLLSTHDQVWVMLRHFVLRSSVVQATPLYSPRKEGVACESRWHGNSAIHTYSLLRPRAAR